MNVTRSFIDDNDNDNVDDGEFVVATVAVVPTIPSLQDDICTRLFCIDPLYRKCRWKSIFEFLLPKYNRSAGLFHWIVDG